LEGTGTVNITLHNEGTYFSNTNTHMKLNTVCTKLGYMEKLALFV